MTDAELRSENVKAAFVTNKIDFWDYREFINEQVEECMRLFEEVRES